MGDYKKNPKRPFEVGVPNKVRKKITMARELDREKLLGSVGSAFSSVSSWLRGKRR